jgi:hypothetical protein
MKPTLFSFPFNFITNILYLKALDAISDTMFFKPYKLVQKNCEQHQHAKMVFKWENQKHLKLSHPLINKQKSLY